MVHTEKRAHGRSIGLCADEHGQPGQAGDGATGSATHDKKVFVIDLHGQKSLGSLIRDRRGALGLTLAAVAARIGCAKSYLSQVETGARRSPPKPEMLRQIEAALGWPAGRLDTPAAWERTPDEFRRKFVQSQKAARELRQLFASGGDAAMPGALDRLHASGRLRRLVERMDPDVDGELGPASSAPAEAPAARTAGSSSGRELGDVLPVALPREVPLINRVTAGYPTEFTDLGYPARVADEYVRVPELSDPDAFAARVVGDSMFPDYREGDVVVFSPARTISDGSDCFARLEPDQETTFKRVYFEQDSAGGELIRLQPLNAQYPPTVLPRAMVAGLYRAVSVVRAIGGD